MAGNPWNRVNIPVPSAISSVRIQFSTKTDTNVKALLVENEKVLKLINSELLQTEVRVLYELLYMLSNSHRGNKTFKSLKQVEQCINRLKNMKLDVVLQDLAEMCPSRVQRTVGVRTGECEVPSQPMLEWLSLRLLGAAQLMSCTVSRCNRAFILTKQQMKWEEFIILNVVITSMLSRLWVIFRAVLVCLASLYKQLVELIREVARCQPMPFLTDFSLPADMTQFLPPSDAYLLSKQFKQDSLGKCIKEKNQQSVCAAPVESQRRNVNANEDLGVAIIRDDVLKADMKPFLKAIRDFTKIKASPQDSDEANEKKKQFKKHLKAAATFGDVAAHLEEMILWFKSQRMRKERRLLTFLQLKCRKLNSLEAAGHSVQRKLKTFRQEASWASSPQGPVPRTLRLLTAVSEDEGRSSDEASSRTTDCVITDDIDHIFSSIGL